VVIVCCVLAVVVLVQGVVLNTQVRGTLVVPLGKCPAAALQEVQVVGTH
jgi:hypothetical protein